MQVAWTARGIVKMLFNSFCYQKNQAEFLNMSLLIKNYSAVGTERNPCSGAACTELLHTRDSIAEDSPCSAGAVQHARGTSSQQQNWGLATGIAHSTPEQKPGPDVPQVGVHLQSPFTLRAPRTQPLANTRVPQGNTSIYTVLILATVTRKGRNTTGVFF